MTPLELFQDMQSRCTEVHVYHRKPGTADGAAVGAILPSAKGGALTVEVGMSVDGEGSVVVRRFDEMGEPIELSIVSVGDATLISG